MGNFGTTGEGDVIVVVVVDGDNGDDVVDLLISNRPFNKAFEALMILSSLR